MKVIIPVAGAGTRMRPHTHSKQKAILPVAGKPMIDHIMEKILPLHPTEVIFITGHLRQRFEKYVHEQYDSKVKVTCIEQQELSGTASAIWLAKSAFDEDVLIDFADTLFDADLSAIKHSKDDAVIWAKEVEDPRRFGVIVVDKDGYATRMVEKPKEFVSNLANIGLYWIRNTKLLAEGIEHVFKSTPAGKEFYLTEAFIYMIAHHAKIKILTAEGWYDCGTPEATLDTNRILLEKAHGKHEVPLSKTVTIIPPVAIHPSAHLERCVVGPYVSVGALATIRDSVVSDAIIDENATVESSVIERSIIGEAARVRGHKRSILLGDHSVME
jgi:glucose-1-phosphate thymidylyltransferase